MIFVRMFYSWLVLVFVGRFVFSFFLSYISLTKIKTNLDIYVHHTLLKLQ
jgi:hypothetical protein